MKKWRRQKSKAERQAWWRSLTVQEQQDYIARRQAKKTKRRYSKRKVRGFEASGVGPNNRRLWELFILSKNPWLDVGVFGNA